jgi:hypothetical protein
MQYVILYSISQAGGKGIHGVMYRAVILGIPSGILPARPIRSSGLDPKLIDYPNLIEYYLVLYSILK